MHSFLASRLRTEERLRGSFVSAFSPFQPLPSTVTTAVKICTCVYTCVCFCINTDTHTCVHHPSPVGSVSLGPWLAHEVPGEIPSLALPPGQAARFLTMARPCAGGKGQTGVSHAGPLPLTLLPPPF